MKKYYVFITIFALSFNLKAQVLPDEWQGSLLEYNTPSENDASNPCITDQEYMIIEQRCNESREFLKINNSKAAVLAPPLLEWPLKATPGITDCSYYRIAAYVDQNTAASAIQDFNCGTNTYDGHRGTDIATWPFNFYKMDNDLVQVVAAAPGTIIDKHDGEFDRNCSSNNLTANYVIIQHADGSVALYWHMKKNKVTTKVIGQTVVAGEYLGIVGSSGSASGPHLHFEVWSGNTVATRVDPYYGNCNKLNASSWWKSQKQARETAIIRASVHTTDIVLPGCPTTETLNEGKTFQVPYQGPGLAPGYAKFYIFLRDEVSGLVADLKILNPNGSTNLSWTYTSSANNGNLTYGWSKKLPLTAGTYTFEATYNGVKCSSTFDITTATGIVQNDAPGLFNIYPNPSDGHVMFVNESGMPLEIAVYNLLGEQIIKAEIHDRLTELNLKGKPGVYFYLVKFNNGTSFSNRMIVK